MPVAGRTPAGKKQKPGKQAECFSACFPPFRRLIAATCVYCWLVYSPHGLPASFSRTTIFRSSVVKAANSSLMPIRKRTPIPKERQQGNLIIQYSCTYDCWGTCEITCQTSSQVKQYDFGVCFRVASASRKARRPGARATSTY